MRIRLSELRQTIRSIIEASRPTIYANPRDIDAMSTDDLNKFVDQSKKKQQSMKPGDWAEREGVVAVAMRRQAEYLRKNPTIKDQQAKDHILRFFIDQVKKEKR